MTGASRLPRRRACLTPLGAIGRGFVAGAVGTLAMDLVWFIRYKRDHGKEGFLDWEFSSGLCSWDQAPAPAQIGKRLVEGLFERKVPATRVPLVNNLTHWGYGILGGTEYGIVAGSVADPLIVYGIPFGATVWATRGLMWV